MERIEDFLRQNALLHAERRAIVTPNSAVTYAELFDKVQAKAVALADKRGQAVVFRSSPTIDFLVTYFAIHVAGAVAVPMEKDATDQQLRQMEQELEGLKLPSDVADILFTTGTTGHPKGVMISHKAILANADNLVAAQGYTHELVFVISGPLNHLGSLSKVYPTVQCGATLYLLEGMKDLNAFYAAFDYPCRKMATFLVPASIRMLLMFSSERLKAISHKIDFIETGAAPMAHGDMKELCQLLPDSRLYNTYASTETGIISTYNYNDGICVGGCLGLPLRHSRFMLTDDGRVACQGDTLMSGYVGNEALTNELLRDGTFLTADLGHVDELGRLYLQGRADDLINVGGLKVAPIEVENAALSMEGIADCLCVPASHPMMGTVLKLLVVPQKHRSFDMKQLAAYLREHLERYKVPMLYEQVERIHKTFNGKPDRKRYGRAVD
ncbi:class I adenylate-forming enzyme family protein [Prevotella sp.]|uniref:class I adenylate-forming enzyme family protein n=1 Tax=Prevotella sp. TaxID=59823 RepID=UPI002F9564C9